MAIDAQEAAIEHGHSGSGQATNASLLQRLKASLASAAGTIVFGMEDGTVSIFGLIFGVAATTSSTPTVLIAGASGAAAAAVSMMAGAYLDAETSRDEIQKKQAQLQSASSPSAVVDPADLANRLTAAGLTAEQSAALSGTVQNDPKALRALLLALQPAPEAPPNPWEQALWMLVADFFSATVPIMPFVLLPISQARIVSAAVTIALLVLLGFGRAQIAGRSVARTVVETVSVGVAAALAGVAIGVLINRAFGG
jgi:VIT1/CCC1 family predicted Fe2+/Mn2+ transporter